MSDEKMSIWSHIDHRRRKLYEHIEKCGIQNEANDVHMELDLAASEIEYDNCDLEFDWANHLVTIDHRCTWFGCKWSWSSTIKFETNIKDVMYQGEN